jgi:type I restriction enzyme, S subunit
MEVKPGYKQTEAGVIPSDWDLTKLGKTCTQVTTGKLDANAMKPDGQYRFYTCAKDFYQIDTYEFDTEALLVSGNGANVGYIHYYKGKFNAYQRTYVLSGFLESVKYLQYYMAQKLGDRIRVEVNAGNTPYITRDTLTEMKVALPRRKTEQDAIAVALSDVDALISALDRLIAKKRDLKQAVMQQLLTGKKRLPGFHGDLTEVDLSKTCSMKSGEAITSANIDAFSIYPCYGGNGLRGFTSRFTHDGSYALIGRQGALCGNVFWVEGKIFASEHAIVVTAFVQTDIRWLTCVLEKMNLNQYSESSAQPGLSVSKILKLAITVPPTKAEQTAIADVLLDMDAELAALEQRRDKTRALKQGMMQELLTGRVRLV